MIWLDFIAPHTGLAIASSLAAWQQALMLYKQLGKDDIYRLSKPVLQFLARLIPALLVLSVCLWWFTGAQWENLTALERITRLLLIIGGSAIAYALTLLGMGIRPKHLASP